MCAARQQRPNGLDRAKPHPRRSARGEDAEDQLLPQPRVRGRAPHLVKLREARAYLATACAVRGAYLLDGDGLSVSPHSARQIQRRGSWNVAEILGSGFSLVKRK